MCLQTTGSQKTLHLRVLGSSSATGIIKGSCKREHTPKTTRKRVPLADIDANTEESHRQESPVPAQAKAGKQPTSKANKKCVAVEEVPLDIVTPEKKKRKSKKSKTEATGTILDVIEFDEGQKTTVADEICKDLRW